MTVTSPFDPVGPLPTGTALLQASAGTGKTHAIAALAARYLAEGVVSIEHLAVISFSRVASDELRSRVRRRLKDTVAVLASAINGDGLPVSADATDTHLARGDAPELQARHDRLRAALTGFDAAAIMTIHQFCQAMLDELGVLATHDPQAKLVEDLGPLVEQVVSDRYLARYATMPDRPFDLETARRLARAAIELPTTPLVPVEPSGLAAERLAFAEDARTHLDARKRRLGVFSFDDQLLRLRDSLRADTTAAGVRRLRRRCQVVLVDEFQDTDPVQWEILQQAFDGHVPLVLIGDPKQSIYAFRGADVTAYTAAASAASAQTFSLSINHRTDAPVVEAISRLFAGVRLGPGVRADPVQPARPGSRLAGNAPAPVRLRCVRSDKLLDAPTARALIDRDLVAEVVSLLSSGAMVIDGERQRRIAEQDIAILVVQNKRGRELSEALAAAGVAVAFSGSDSILASPAAQDWLTLLRALEQPRRAAVREAILTDFIGADLTALATADDDQLLAWSARLQRWARLLSSHGVAALFAAVQSDGPQAEGGLSERLLRRRRGERDLTDHRQLAEILHAQYSAGRRGPALVAWLSEQITLQDGSSDRTRRLETDRHAVQLMTVHKAKGLQFPVVFVPQAADLYLSDEDSGGKLDFHDESGQRVLDLGGKDSPGRASRVEAEAKEQAEDRLRALYVATTRAESQLTLWWAPTMRTTESSPLHRLLYRERSTDTPPQATYPLTDGPATVPPTELAWLREAGIVVEDCAPDRTPHFITDRPHPALIAPVWRRQIDHSWRRTSYSGLTEAVHARAPHLLELVPSSEVVTDEPSADAVNSVSEADGPRSPMADLPGGTSFGSLVHEVLERLDWHAPSPAEFDARLLSATTAAAQRFALAGLDPADLAAGLRPSLLTPLGRLTGGAALADIAITDRLSELDFEFALGSADSLTTLAEVAALLRRWLPADDPLVGYPDDLGSEPLASQTLRGFLTGSIDSVLRIHTSAGPRFVIVDYKTNRLGPAELRLDHYNAAAMTAEMRRTHYPLQALLYCVALHRFLRARLPEYDPTLHLGGVGYLFVRGLGGPDAGADTGVFDWYPPAGLVIELSDLLADRRRA